MLQEVSKMTTAEALWKRLETLYLTKTLSTQLFLKTKFFSFNMGDGQKLHDYIDEYNKLCLDLENLDIKYDDEDKVLVLLRSLPKSYETFVDILKHGRDKLSLEDVVGALNSKELQQKVEGKNSMGDALAVRSRPEKDQRSKGRSRSKSSKKPIKCFFRHEEGHIKRNFPKRKGEFQGKKNAEISSSICEFDYDNADALVVSNTEDRQVWVLDSSCSFHMTSHKDWFLSYKDINGGKVLLGNNQECKIKGIGNVKIKMHDGTVRILLAIRYVPDLKRNLISHGGLDKNGYSYRGVDGVFKVSRGSPICMKEFFKMAYMYCKHPQLVGN